MTPAEAYDRYIVQNVFVPWTADLVERARPRRGERVLDLACGTGVIAKTVAPVVAPGGTVSALDISPEMLVVGRSTSVPEGAAIEWHEGSGIDMPFPDESFDLVLCQQGLQFFPDHAAGLREIRRVLRPGGRTVVSVWRKLEEAPFMASLDRVISNHLSEGAFARGTALADARHFEELAKKAGFGDVVVEKRILTLQIADPETFVPMMLRASAAVVPLFAERTPAEREALIERMKEEVTDAVRPFLRDHTLVVETSANVLSATRESR